jgi:Tn3 transposase DDE domain
VLTWMTEHYGLAVESMCRSGRRVDDEVLAHISPAHSENINFFGSIEMDIEGELAQLGPTGYRPLRVRDTLFREPPGRSRARPVADRLACVRAGSRSAVWAPQGALCVRDPGLRDDQSRPS